MNNHITVQSPMISNAYEGQCAMEFGVEHSGITRNFTGLCGNKWKYI